MSWDPYIDSVIGRCSGNCDSVCIIGLDGSPWTTGTAPNGIPIQPDEATNIAGALSNKDFTTFQANGVRLGGKKYTFLREEEGKLVLAKLKDNGAVTIQRTKKCAIIAHCKEGGVQGAVNDGVNKIAEYIESTE